MVAALAAHAGMLKKMTVTRTQKFKVDTVKDNTEDWFST